MLGLIQLPWWGYIVVTLVLTQITIFGVTVFLHRYQAHRSLDLHPVVSHFFRFWLWMTTGQVTKEWAAIHRKHHARVETAEDPHSPQIHGLKKVLLQGAELYRKEKQNQETLDRFGEGTPDDWMERHVYTKHSGLGATALLFIQFALFGFIGIAIWAIQMAWIPFFAGGVINGVGHYAGYRNFECPDASRNILPWGLFIGGEELHNNHHTYGTSAKFSVKWWEVDLGWGLIRLLQLFGLAQPKRLPPKARILSGKSSADLSTLKAILSYRHEVMADFRKRVITPLLRQEFLQTDKKDRSLLRRAKRLLTRESSLLDMENQNELRTVLEQHPSLNRVYQFRLKLQSIWAKSTASQNALLESLQEWCRCAEESGIEVLREFVTRLRTYSL